MRGNDRKQPAIFSHLTLTQRIPADHPARKVKLRGLERVDWFWKLSVTAHRLVRMRRPIPIQALAS
jgi:hypothetical protein